MADTKKLEILPVRKITTDSFGNKDKVKAKSEPLPIMKIMGKANGYTRHPGQFGEYKKFHGDFIAKAPDGRIIRSSILILPEFMIAGLAAQLDKQEIQEVDLGFDISTTPDRDERNSKGYTFLCGNLFAPEPSQDALLAFARGKGLLG